MDGLRRWQSLDQLCKDMLDQSFRLEDSVRLALQLVSQLESDLISTKTGNMESQELLISDNRNEELLE